MNNWSLHSLVTDLIAHTAISKPEKRNELWASDLGKPHLDTFLRVKGVPYTNPANGDGLYNFFLGKAIEEGLTNMLKMCGIAHTLQDKKILKTFGNLDVVGKPDIVLEVTDWQSVIKTAKSVSDDDNDKRNLARQQALVTLLENWKTKYPEGLPLTAFEIKSCSDWTFQTAKSEGFKKTFPHYFLQAYTYLKAMELDEVHLLFVSKGSKFYTEEIVLIKSESMEEEWNNEVRTLSDAIISNIEPLPEPLMVRSRFGREVFNWQLKYSPYFDYIMGKYYPNYLVEIKGEVSN